VTVAQISDMHIRRRGQFLPHMPHVAQPLHRVLSAIAKLRPAPQAIIATGDLTESGTAPEYERLREILERCAGVPIYLVPGNHDRCGPLRSVFSDHEYLRESEHGLLFTVEMSSLRVIAVDSTEEGRPEGHLSKARLEWLSMRLRERRDVPTIVALHHPPFPTGVGPFDRQPFAGREELMNVVRTHDQIRRVICGHVHQPLARAWCGTLGVTAPSTAPTLALHPRAPGLSWEPGGFLLHRCEPNGGVSTTLIRIAAEPTSLTA
jgi:3',5'-cyclic-AMP phosphodiesterase